MKKLIALSLVFTQFFYCLNSQNRILSFRGDNFKIEETIEKEISILAGQKLTVELDNASDVTVKGWDKENALIKIYKKGPEAELIKFEFKETSKGPIIKGWMLEDNIRRLRADMEILVPSKINLDISAFRNESKININDIRGLVKVICYDDLELQNVNGEIDIMSSAESIKLIAVNGSINVTKSSGIIANRKINKLISQSTENVMEQYPPPDYSRPGNIKIELSKDYKNNHQNVEINSDGGDIELIVPEKFPMNIDCELSYRKEGESEYDIISDFDIKTEKPVDWVVIPTNLVKWTDSKDKRYTIYGIWENNQHTQVRALYKERKLRGDKGYSMTTIDGENINVKNIKAQITPIEIHEKTITCSGKILGGDHNIKIKTRDGNIYLRKSH
jgi:hypothetical protein